MVEENFEFRTDFGFSKILKNRSEIQKFAFRIRSRESDTFMFEANNENLDRPEIILKQHNFRGIDWMQNPAIVGEDIKVSSEVACNELAVVSERTLVRGQCDQFLGGLYIHANFLPRERCAAQDCSRQPLATQKF